MINMTTIPDELDLAGAGTNPSGGILGLLAALPRAVLRNEP